MIVKLTAEITPFVRNRLFRVVVAMAYTALLTLVLLQSSAHPYVGPSAPRAFDLRWEILMTAAHLTSFALLVIFIWSALFTVMSSNKALIIAVIFACSLGLITELLQTLVPDRGASLFDLACDCGIALLVAYIIHRQMRNTA